MSLRYVWKKYTIGTRYSAVRDGTAYDRVSGAIYLGDGYSFDYENGLYQLRNPEIKKGDAALVYFQYAIMGGSTGKVMYSTPSSAPTASYWYDDDGYLGWRNGTTGKVTQCYKHIVKESQGSGELVGEAVHKNNSKYPTNGVSGSYWYIYQGSDSIDPVAVNLSQSSGLYVGLPITISVYPSTFKVYGGTVSYQYQVQLNNNGQWVTLGTTTETSYSYTIPTGATNLQFRVLASDDLGFTSTDYANSASVSVVAFKPGTQQVLHRKNTSGNYDVIWLETDSDVVIRPDGTKLSDVLANIESRLSELGV